MRSRWEVFFQVSRQQLAKVAGRVSAFTNRVRAVRIGHHRERLVVTDELVDQGFGRLVVTVVVAGAVDDEQIALEAIRVVDGGTLANFRSNYTFRDTFLETAMSWGPQCRN